MKIFGDPAIDSVISVQQAAVKTSVDAAILKKVSDSGKIQAKAALQLLQAVAPQGKAAGKGGAFDAVG